MGGELETGGLVSLVALAAGFVDAVAGGGGLLTLPALLLAGLPPAAAIATNKLQGTFGVAASSHAYWRAGLVDIGVLIPSIAGAGLGAAAGSAFVSRVDPGLLKVVVPAILVMIALYFAFAPYRGVSERRQRLAPIAFAATIAFPIGFYDGFLGPGAGSFFMAGLTLAAGLGLIEATAHTKILNLTSNVVALVVFLFAGKVVFAFGVPMALGQIIGASLGARNALRHGATIIRPMIVVVSLLIAIRLLVAG